MPRYAKKRPAAAKTTLPYRAAWLPSKAFPTSSAHYNHVPAIHSLTTGYLSVGGGSLGDGSSEFEKRAHVSIMSISPTISDLYTTLHLLPFLLQRPNNAALAPPLPRLVIYLEQKTQVFVTPPPPVP